MATQERSRIVSTPDVLGGKPRIEGTRIGVAFVKSQVDGRGLDPREVAERYELDLPDVYRALAYYHEHPDEMAAIEQRREALEARAMSDPAVAIGPEEFGESR